MIKCNSKFPKNTYGYNADLYFGLIDNMWGIMDEERMLIYMYKSFRCLLREYVMQAIEDINIASKSNLTFVFIFKNTRNRPIDQDLRWDLYGLEDIIRDYQDKAPFTSRYRNDLIKEYYDRRNEIKDKLTDAILNLREDGYFDYSGIEYDIPEEEY